MDYSLHINHGEFFDQFCKECHHEAWKRVCEMIGYDPEREKKIKKIEQEYGLIMFGIWADNLFS